MNETAMGVEADGGADVTDVQFGAAENGASVRALMARTYYPLRNDTRQKPKRTSVSFSSEEYGDLLLIAELWNAMDKALKHKRKKWKVASVIEHLATVGVNGFWQQVGGRPAGLPGREKWLKQAIEQLQKLDNGGDELSSPE